MKKSYNKPEILVVNLESSQIICFSDNAGLDNGGPGHGDGRAADYRMRGSDWDEYFN
ncbi:MAG: hypothetical protein IJS20_02250 [Bacteroidales bacterium]|nr:hypothetical protein [Bacteroidales bacterium]